MPKYINLTFVVLILLSNTISVFAQADSIDVFVNAQMQKRKIPGLQLAIVRDGKIIKTGNYGIANVQDSIPVNDKTVFTINSITKAFTGVAIMQLVEAGKLKLSSPISEFNLDIPQSWNKVTVQQLLSHTSGIPDIVDPEETLLISPQGEGASWKLVQTLPMDFEPGAEFRYNQNNYLLLGKIIDKQSGMPFKDFITKYQLEKVGMPKTIKSGFGATMDIVMNSAGGYRISKGKLVNMFFSLPPTLQTAAGMSSTATELAQWVIALQQNKLLTQKSTLDQMWTPAYLNNGKISAFSSFLNGYGAGWPIVSRKNHPVYAAVGGGRNALMIYPKDNLSIIILTNLAGAVPEIFIDEIAAFYVSGLR